VNRELTWGTAAVIALATAVGISTESARRGGEDTGQERPITKVAPSAPKPIRDRTGRACSEIEDLLRAFLLPDSDSVAAPNFCFEPNLVPPASVQHELMAKAAGLGFVIATLPDPLHTHFSLLFDRNAEAVQWAAQDEGFVYDSSWLPWETQEQALLFLDDQDRAEDRKHSREDQPGVLLFRKKTETPSPPQPACPSGNCAREPFTQGLVVFIVGEEATRGIHRAQFENAVAWINALHPPLEGKSLPVTILGPSFSGSFPSLAELLADGKVHDALGYPSVLNAKAAPLRVYSGSVSSKEAAEWFGTVAGSDLRLQDWNISFHSFLADDDTTLASFCSYLNTQGTRVSDVAIISEDETAYGSSQMTDSTCTSALKVYYPRDMSALRAAYQTESIFTSASPQQSAEMRRRNLPSDLADPAGETHDTIRPYGGNQTPLSQEAYMLGVVRALRSRHSQYLVVRCSNTLDALFLSNFFRRAYPEGRVVIIGADLLFQRESGSTGISGVMTLSTYPFFAWGSDWTTSPTPNDDTTRRVFNADLVEGTYIAARFLLHNPSALGDDATTDTRCSSQSPASRSRCFLPSNLSPSSFALPLPDYAAPLWRIPISCRTQVADPSCIPYLRPATWLSVLGRGDFYPAAEFSPDSSQGTSESQASKELSGIKPHAPTMPLSMKLCLICILVIAGFHAYCCWEASFTAKPAFRAHFATTQNWSPYGEWRHPVLIYLGSVAIALASVVGAWGCGAFTQADAPLPDPWFVRTFLLIACCVAVGSVVANNVAIGRIEADRRKDEPQIDGSNLWLRKRLALLLTLCLSTIVVFIAACILPLELVLNADNRIPTYWRSMSLTSGVSPIVPFLAIFAGIYAWFRCSLHGLALFGLDRPNLPPMSSLKITDEKGGELNVLRMFSQEDAAKIEDAAIPLERTTLWMATILFLLSIAIAFAIAHQVPVRTLGTKRYALVFCLWLDACCSWLLAEAFQLWRMWSRLKQLLGFLDRLPLRRTLAALRGFSWGSVWKMSGNVLEVRYKLVSRQFECLNHLRASFEDLENSSYDEETDREILAVQGCLSALAATEEARLKFAKWYATKYLDPVADSFTTLETFQQSVAVLAGKLLTEVLIPAWRKEKQSLILIEEGEKNQQQSRLETAPPLAAEEYIRNAEELVCLPYLGFVQNVLGRMRSLVLGIVCLFVAVTISVSTYPFDPRPTLTGVLACVFIVLGSVISLVYARMHRDSTLSHVTNTKPGELGAEFWIKLIGFGIGPLIGLLTNIFPVLADFLFSWLEPGLASLK
jgi:hypothetical protein